MYISSITKGWTSIDKDVIPDPGLRRIIPILCNNITFTDGQKWEFNNLVNLGYDHFIMWVLKFDSKQFDVIWHHTDEEKIMEYVKHILCTVGDIEPSDFEIRIICINRTELVFSIEITC